MSSKRNSGTDKPVVQNRKARHDYAIEETIEAGIVLAGTEVKSIRRGKADLKDAYGMARNGELFLIGMHVSPYEQASHFNHDPRRERKLLLNKREIQKLTAKICEKGYTLVPLEIYFKNGFAKVLLGIAKGKKQWDNRDEITAKEERKHMREMLSKHQ